MISKSVFTSKQLCAKCFNFYEMKLLKTSSSCFSCRQLRTSIDSVRGLRDANEVKAQAFPNSNNSPVNPNSPPFLYLNSRNRSFSQSQGIYSSRSIYENTWLACSSAQQNIFIRSFANHTPVPPNPLPPRKKSKDDSQKSPISWRNLVIVAGIGGALLLGMSYVKKEKEQERQKAKNLKMGKAKLGGDWTLVDHHGKLRSSTDFRGQWLLIYFGFTNCPDICPEEMEKIVSVIEKTDADPDLPKIQPILITVDPDRDTPEALKEYCAEFSPRLLGFSGSQEQIYAATRAYRVYFSQGPKDEDNDYIVDHSIISYLVNPEGDFVDYFGQNKKVEEMFKSIKLHIWSYQKAKKEGN